jgi:AcrR family transcriptional regulator
LEAALAEFSAYGVAGARVDRIAREAGCNKNLIYIYFESKENLFTTVLQKNLLRLYQEIAFNAADLPGYAGRVFDYTLAHPDLMRLVAWTSLEQQAVTPAERLGVHNGKVEEIRQAQKDGLVNPHFDPGFILIMVMTMANTWSAANPYGMKLDPAALNDPAKLRESIVTAVTLLVQVPG